MAFLDATQNKALINQPSSPPNLILCFVFLLHPQPPQPKKNKTKIRYGRKVNEFYNLTLLDPAYRIELPDGVRIDVPGTKEGIVEMARERGGDDDALSLELFFAEANEKFQKGVRFFVYNIYIYIYIYRTHRLRRVLQPPCRPSHRCIHTRLCFLLLLPVVKPHLLLPPVPSLTSLNLCCKGVRVHLETNDLVYRAAGR